MKNKKGFTLIELLAVIIILGVLMIIAVPSVTKYINESKKNGYISTAKELAGSARTLAYSGNYTMDDKDTTYYIDGECLKTENGYRSPYGKFEHAYVAVTATDNDHEYYWFSVDDTGTGVRSLTNVEKLEMDSIESGIEAGEITPTIGIDKRKKIVTISGENCTKSAPVPAGPMMNSKTGKIREACPEVTETIYWAIQNNKLTISNSEVSGTKMGNFPGNTVFDDYDNSAPWNKIVERYNISEVEVVGSVVPISTEYWFQGTGENSSSFSADLSNLNVCHSTSMKYMFEYAGRSATTYNLNLGDWDTSKITDMSWLFSYSGWNATNWSVSGLSDWDTSNVTTMRNAFEYFGAKASNVNVDLSSWDTSKVTDMHYLFYYSGAYSGSFSLNLNNWNLSSTTNINDMLYYLGNGSTTFNLKVNNWNVKNIIDMSGMFENVGENATTWAIEGLNSWDTSNVQSMSSMFYSVGHNATTFNLDISNWNTSSVYTFGSMFENVGDNATTFNLIIPKSNSKGLNNTTSTMYGREDWVTASPPTGRVFTVAN